MIIGRKRKRTSQDLEEAILKREAKRYGGHSEPFKTAANLILNTEETNDKLKEKNKLIEELKKADSKDRSFVGSVIETLKPLVEKNQVAPEAELELKPNDGEDLGYPDLVNFFTSFWTHIGKVGSALEIGAGTGRLTHIIKVFAEEVDVLDTNQDYLNFIRNRYPGLVSKSYCQDASNLGNIEKKYDVVVICGVAQYFNDDAFNGLLA